MKTTLFIKSKGFNVNEPNFVYLPLTSGILVGITSRDFGMPYESMEEQIAGSLYLWLQQSYSVLWEVKAEQRKLLLYDNTIDKLGERFATLLKLSKEAGKSATWDMVRALALSNYILSDVAFKMEGNWLLKYPNSSLNGLHKHFIFWLASTELADNERALSCLRIFMKKFAKDVDLQFTTRYSEQAIMDTFIQCFFHGQNEIDLFFSALQNPNVSIYEIR